MCLVLQKKTTAVERFVKKFFTVQNVTLALLWLAWVALLVYVQTISHELAPFDPYEILKVRTHSAIRVLPLLICLCVLPHCVDYPFPGSQPSLK